MDQRVGELGGVIDSKAIQGPQAEVLYCLLTTIDLFGMNVRS